MKALALLAALLFALPLSAQTAPVRPGSDSLDASALTSSQATFKVRLVQPVQQDAGTYTESITVDQEAGTITSVSRLSVPMANQTQTDSLVAAWPSLAPMSHQSQSSQRLLALTFDEGIIGGMSMPSGGDMEMIDLAVDEPVFDSGWIPQIIRSLPLAEGYTTRVAVYDAERSETSSYTVTVTGQEEMTTPDGPATVWVVTTQAGPMTFTYFFDTTTTEMQRMRFSPQPGVVIELVRQ